jgi:hypothetical protein
MMTAHFYQAGGSIGSGGALPTGIVSTRNTAAVGEPMKGLRARRP